MFDFTANSKYSLYNPIRRRGVVVTIGSNTPALTQQHPIGINPPLADATHPEQHRRRIRDPSSKYHRSYGQSSLSPVQRHGHTSSTRGLQQQIHHRTVEQREIQKPPFAGRNPYSNDRFEVNSCPREEDCLSFIGFTANHGQEEHTHFFEGECNGSTQPIMFDNDRASVPHLEEPRGIARFKPRTDSPSQAWENLNEFVQKENFDGLQPCYPETHSVVNHFAENERRPLQELSRQQQQQQLNSNAASFFGIDDPPREAKEWAFAPVNDSASKCSQGLGRLHNHNLPKRSECHGESSKPPHIDEICIPAAGFHRRTSDITDAFNDASSKTNILRTQNFPGQHQAGNTSFAIDRTLQTAGLQHLQKDSYYNNAACPQRTCPEEEGKNPRGVSRFHVPQNIESNETDSSYAFLNEELSGLVRTNCTPKDSYAHPVAPKSCLRFFNNGVEIDLSGKHISAASGFQEPISSPAVENSLSCRSAGPLNNGTDGRLSPDSSFLESTNWNDKSFWDYF